MTKTLRGLRGATTAAANSREAILNATAELLRALQEANGFRPEEVESAIFTSSPDLTAEYPARAARLLGWSDVPLLGAAEVAVPDGLSRCIRVLLHFYTATPTSDTNNKYQPTPARRRLVERAHPRGGRPARRARRHGVSRGARRGGRPPVPRRGPLRPLRRRPTALDRTGAGQGRRAGGDQCGPHARRDPAAQRLRDPAARRTSSRGRRGRWRRAGNRGGGGARDPVSRRPPRGPEDR